MLLRGNINPKPMIAQSPYKKNLEHKTIPVISVKLSTGAIVNTQIAVMIEKRDIDFFLPKRVSTRKAAAAIPGMLAKPLRNNSSARNSPFLFT